MKVLKIENLKNCLRNKFLINKKLNQKNQNFEKLFENRIFENWNFEKLSKNGIF